MKFSKHPRVINAFGLNSPQSKQYSDYFDNYDAKLLGDPDVNNAISNLERQIMQPGMVSYQIAIKDSHFRSIPAAQGMAFLQIKEMLPVAKIPSKPAEEAWAAFLRVPRGAMPIFWMISGTVFGWFLRQLIG